MEILLEETERCGEVCLSRNGILFFICCLCDHNFKDYKAYLSHITSEHKLQFSFWDDIQDPIDIEEQTEYIDYEELLDVSEDFSMPADEETLVNEIEYVISEEARALETTNQKTIILNNEDKALQLPIEDEECQQQKTSKENYSNFKCPHCSKVIKSKGNFDKHLLRHSEQNKRYACEIDGCTKRFFQRFELIQHERSHTGERPYNCTDCGLSFITGGKLNAHISKKHKNERKKVCNICNKAFFNNNFLRSHMAVHTEERNHVCVTCKAAFKHRKTLVAHIKLHENRFEHKCDECDAKFNQRPALKAHMKRTHLKHAT